LRLHLSRPPARGQPLFFAINGLRVDTAAITDSHSAWLLVVNICIAAVAKAGSTVLVSMFYGMPVREGLSLGILLNTKGLIEMIVLHIGLDKKILDRQSFSVMVLMSLAFTALVMPLVTVVYKSARHFVSYKHRTIQRSKPDTELWMLACVHTTRNVPSIINLLEVSHPSKRSPIFVYRVTMVDH
ncbi:hypothetical protein Taro_055919, partial [Colocasia esculenta]|nr:hypothetical protein [Colocasia esculenta]